MNTRRFRGPAVSAIVFVLSVCLAEIVLRAFAPVPDPYLKYKQKFLNLRNQYIKSEFPPNYSAKTEVEPGLPGIQGFHTFTTNNMGFRGEVLVNPKPDNEFRIFIVGGSTTECLYLNDSESIDRVLQDELRRKVSAGKIVRVYNAGKSGDATDDHISMIVHRIAHLSPDMIIVFCGINDLTRSIYRYDYLHYARLDPSDASANKIDLLKFLGTEFQIPRRVYYLLTKLSPQSDGDILEDITMKSNYRLKIELRRSHPASEMPPRTDIESYRRNLETIVGVAQAHKIDLVLMTQQTTWNSGIDPTARNWHWLNYRAGVTYREDLMDQALEKLNDAMREIARTHSITIYDLAREIPKSSEFFYDDVHFNVKGAYSAGVGLASVITKNNAIPR